MNRLLDLLDRIFPPKRYHHRNNGPVTINPDVRETIIVWGTSKGNTVTTETSARDELAREIFIADNSNAPDPAAEWGKADARQRHYAYAIADGLLAAGYRKPRTITTAEELQALPHGSVIRSEQRHYWVAHKEDGEGGNQGWAAAGSSHIPDLTTWLPATLLHEGGAE